MLYKAEWSRFDSFEARFISNSSKQFEINLKSMITRCSDLYPGKKIHLPIHTVGIVLAIFLIFRLRFSFCIKTSVQWTFFRTEKDKFSTDKVADFVEMCGSFSISFEATVRNTIVLIDVETAVSGTFVGAPWCHQKNAHIFELGFRTVILQKNAI